MFMVLSYCFSLHQVKALARPLHIDQDLQTMLTFYHDLGRLIYFGNLSEDKSAFSDVVILDPQWLVDVFKKVITFQDAKSMRGLVSRENKYRCTIIFHHSLASCIPTQCAVAWVTSPLCTGPLFVLIYSLIRCLPLGENWWRVKDHWSWKFPMLLVLFYYCYCWFLTVLQNCNMYIKLILSSVLFISCIVSCIAPWFLHIMGSAERQRTLGCPSHQPYMEGLFFWPAAEVLRHIWALWSTVSCFRRFINHGFIRTCNAYTVPYPHKLLRPFTLSTWQCQERDWPSIMWLGYILCGFQWIIYK